MKKKYNTTKRTDEHGLHPEAQLYAFHATILIATATQSAK